MTGVPPATDPKSPVSGGTISWLRKCTSKILKISPIRKIESEDVSGSRDEATLFSEKADIEDPAGGIPGNENEAELSFAIVNDYFDARMLQSGNDIAEVEANHDPSIDNPSNIDVSKAPEDLQPSDSKVEKQKPRKGGGRGRVKRTQTVKAVLEEAKAILGESNAAEVGPGESNAEDSANVISESQKPSNTRRPANVRKRNRVQTSQVTASGHDGDASEGHSDSLVPGQRKRRRQKAAAPPVQISRETRYNLRRPKSGATSSARAMSGGGKESEGEVDRVKDTEGNVYSKTSHSHSVGVTNENGGSIDLEESQKVVGTQDGYGDTARTLSEEVNRTADDIEEHGSEYRSESHGGVDEEDDEDYPRPGETSIGKKLWTFFTT